MFVHTCGAAKVAKKKQCSFGHYFKDGAKTWWREETMRSFVKWMYPVCQWRPFKGGEYEIGHCSPVWDGNKQSQSRRRFVQDIDASQS